MTGCTSAAFKANSFAAFVLPVLYVAPHRFIKPGRRQYVRDLRAKWRRRQDGCGREKEGCLLGFVLLSVFEEAVEK